MALFSYSFPTRIEYGPGAVTELGAVLRGAGVARPLVVTDRGLAPLAPVTKTEARLAGEGFAVSVFSGVWGNPVASQVTAGVAAYRAHGADAVVAIGGGAAIDVAKAVILMVHHPGELFDYEDEKPGALPIDREIPFFVTIPTTAGTGSEVGRSTVISDEVTHVKKIVFSPRLLAKHVLLDPELTLGLPAAITASTGMDALTHLVESYLARGFNPLCDGIALEGVRLVARALVPAVDFARRVEQGERALLDDPAHLEARGLMLNAAMMGAVAFQKGLGVTHSLAHALSTVCDLHHGLANGIAIPYAMTFNASVAADRLGDLARAAGAERHDAAGFVRYLETLRAAVGIPSTLSEVGVRAEHLPRLVEIAVHDGCHANNPRAVQQHDFVDLFTRALG
jgi:alcohol dehydrogenase class IV